MKPYMAYSREGGACEGACLVFAHTVKEAKVEAWGTVSDYFTDEYTDMAVTWMKGKDFLLAEADPIKLAEGIPHVISDPTPCKDCELWGSKLNEQGYCEDCWEERTRLRDTGVLR